MPFTQAANKVNVGTEYQKPDALVMAASQQPVIMSQPVPDHLSGKPMVRTDAVATALFSPLRPFAPSTGSGQRHSGGHPGTATKRALDAEFAAQQHFDLAAHTGDAEILA